MLTKKDKHLAESGPAQLAVDYGPGEKENQLDVEQHKKHGREIKPDRQAAFGERKGSASAFKGLVFGRVGPFRAEDRGQQNKNSRNPRGKHKSD